jgi:transcriptional regulator with XRE-family HTH domain
MTLGDVIRATREDAGISRESFASELGVSIKTIYRWEAGKREPKMDRIREIASLVRIPFQEFIAKTSNPTPPSTRAPKGPRAKRKAVNAVTETASV